jgi:hypothetical protein
VLALLAAAACSDGHDNGTFAAKTTATMRQVTYLSGAGIQGREAYVMWPSTRATSATPAST